jgi:type II secretory pathway component HofQ
MVLRSLSQEGEAEILTSPTIVVTQGVPAVVASRLLLPASLFTRADDPFGGGRIVTNTGVSEEAGVRLEVVADWIGADHLVLRLHPWVRELTAARTSEGPQGYPVLAVRELTTVVTLADGEEVLLGGVEGWSRVNDRTGLPVPPALSALGSAIASRLDDTAKVDLVFRVRARILHPGRDGASSVPPCEDERLRLGRIAGAIPKRR